jgi:hypothetical protein
MQQRCLKSFSIRQTILIRANKSDFKWMIYVRLSIGTIRLSKVNTKREISRRQNIEPADVAEARIDDNPIELFDERSRSFIPRGARNDTNGVKLVVEM